MFGKGVGDDIMSALMLWEDLVCLMGPPNMMVFKIDVTRFRWDEGGFGEFD